MMKELILAGCILVICLISLNQPAYSEIEDSDFNNIQNWRFIPKEAEDCDAPCRYILKKVGAPDKKFGLLGNKGNPAPAGCNSSSISQKFTCGDGDPPLEPYTVVSFDYQFYRKDVNDKARAILSNTFGASLINLDPTEQYCSVLMHIEGCTDNTVIQFFISSSNQGHNIKSMYTVDNVKSRCISGYTDSSGQECYEIGDISELPIGWDDTLNSAELSTCTDLVWDCNDNDIPDAYEISMGWAVDADSNGFIDGCNVYGVPSMTPLGIILLGCAIFGTSLFLMIRQRRMRRVKRL